MVHGEERAGRGAVSRAVGRPAGVAVSAGGASVPRFRPLHAVPLGRVGPRGAGARADVRQPKAREVQGGVACRQGAGVPHGRLGWVTSPGFSVSWILIPLIADIVFTFRDQQSCGESLSIAFSGSGSNFA